MNYFYHIADSGRYQLTNANDTITVANYYSARVFALGGNDSLRGVETGTFWQTILYDAGDGDDRLVIGRNDFLDDGGYYLGGEGTDTLEISTNYQVFLGLADFDSDVRTATLYGEQSETWQGFARILLYDVERFVIKAGEFDDYFAGGAFNDWFEGGGGTNSYDGSAGDDGYVISSVTDRVRGEIAGGGVDTIWATVSIDLRQQSLVENLRLQCGDISGTGNALANTITGSAGNNVIAGGLGIDQLWGKGGSDTFAFAEMGAANRDTIFDFDEGDKIQLSQAVFTGLDANDDGTLDAIALSLNGKAAGSSAQLIYNGNTGILSYDADGKGAGAAEEIAFIGKKLGSFLGTDDFLLVA